MRVAAVLVIVALFVAGCVQTTDTPKTPTPDGPEPTPTGHDITAGPTPPATPTNGTPEPSKTGGLDGYVRDDHGAVPGSTVTILETGESTVAASDGSFAFRDLEPGPITLRAEHAASNRTANATATIVAGDVELIFITLPNAATVVTPQPPTVPGRFICPGDEVVEEASDTFGSGDPAVPSLAWASLKTGFRAVVVWTTDDMQIGSLQVSIGGAPYTTKRETTPRTEHVFILDDLPQGNTLCFQVPGAATHAMRLVNGPTSGDGDGHYTLNLLILVNEASAQGAVRSGIDRYAELLWDATDGHMRAGMNIIIIGDYEHHNSGWAACALIVTTSPACHNDYDVIFTLDAYPGGAASTYLDGITDDSSAIWMNWYWQANPVLDLDDEGSVLVHEIGHYALGMQDMYTSSGGDCWIEQYQLSIMGGSRDANEFDDATHRCPNESAIRAQYGGYEPGWVSFMARYPGVEDRPDGPDPGPDGNGGIYVQRVVTVTP